MPNWDRIKNERIAMYFDIILGIVISSASLFGIIFFSLTESIEYFSVYYVLGVVFWISWLIFSIVLMVIGIKSYLDTKHFEKTGKPKKPRNIKAPMVS